MARTFPPAPRNYYGVCVGGPLHGQVMECRSPELFAPDPKGFTHVVERDGHRFREPAMVRYIYRPPLVYSDSNRLWAVELPPHWMVERMPFAEAVALALSLDCVAPPQQLWHMKLTWDNQTAKKPIGGLVVASGWDYRLKV